MRKVYLIARRELQAYLRTMSGYVIIASMLFLAGLLFALAMRRARTHTPQRRDAPSATPPAVRDPRRRA